MKKVRVAINGLGRIGRTIIRVKEELKRNDIDIVALNGPAPAETHAHLLKYDSVYGRFSGEVATDGHNLVINGKSIPLIQERDPANINWGKYGADIVLECTGKFRKKEEAKIHLDKGAKKVLISAPSPDADCMIVYGVNNDQLKPEDEIISVGSCTTNCLAPVVKVLQETIGIKSGHMTTIHSYTSDQRLLDGSHKDLRRARTATVSMIPTSTGAASAMAKIFPELKGKIDGTAIRVPTPNVSMVDFTFISEKASSTEKINESMKEAANSNLKNVLGYSDEPLVSIDFTANPNSSVFDATATNVIGDESSGNRIYRIAAWYDNEWGFSARMLDVSSLVTQ